MECENYKEQKATFSKDNKFLELNQEKRRKIEMQPKENLCREVAYQKNKEKGLKHNEKAKREELTKAYHNYIQSKLAIRKQTYLLSLTETKKRQFKSQRRKDLLREMVFKKTIKSLKTSLKKDFSDMKEIKDAYLAKHAELHRPSSPVLVSKNSTDTAERSNDEVSQ